MTIVPSVLRHCWMGDRKDIRTVKSWVLACWCRQIDWSFARLMAAVVTISIILSSIKSRMETFWYWLTQIHLEKRPLERTERTLSTGKKINSKQ